MPENSPSGTDSVFSADYCAFTSWVPCTPKSPWLDYAAKIRVDPGGPPFKGPFFFILWSTLLPGQAPSMNVAHEHLHGLDRDRVIAVVEPVLRAHNVEGVELVWRTDRAGWVLELTVERPGSTLPGAGVTIDLCSEISRDLSAALDVADVIDARYSLQVGSPGLERAL